MIETIALFLVKELGSKLFESVYRAASASMKAVLDDTERAEALQKCLDAGLIEMFHSVEIAPEHKEHLRDVLTHFVQQPKVGFQLERLLRGKSPEIEELVEALQEAGFVADDFPGFDAAEGFTRLVQAFYETAKKQPALRDEIKIELLLENARQHGIIIEQDAERNRRLEQIGATLDRIAERADSGDRIPGEALKAQYLRYFEKECGHVPLSDIDESHPHEARTKTPVRLSDVYTSMYVRPLRRGADTEKPGPGREHDLELFGAGDTPQRRLGASEAVFGADRLVVLGEPGIGKSTLVNHLVTHMASRGLGRPVARPLPGWPGALASLLLCFW